MSDHTHVDRDGNITVHDAEGKMTFHLYRGTNRRYVARVRRHGDKKYSLLGKPTKSYSVAIKRMAAAFAENQSIKRGDVLLIADWYDPAQLCELVRRR